MRSQGAWQERITVLVDEIVGIADAAESKDDIPAAKLKIEARQWIVETYLLKLVAARGGDVRGEPISVTITTAADAG